MLNALCHNIVKGVCGSTRIMTKFMINKKTDAWKTDVNGAIKLFFNLNIIQEEQNQYLLFCCKDDWFDEYLFIEFSLSVSY